MLNAIKNESETLMNAVNDEIAHVEEAKRLARLDIDQALSQRKTESRDYWHVYDCIHQEMIPKVEQRIANIEFLAKAEIRRCREVATDAMSRMAERLEMTEEDRLSKLHISSQYWRSGWKAHRLSQMHDYNSLQDVFHFGPPSKEEQRWHVRQAVTDLVNSTEAANIDTSGTGHIYQFMHGDHWQVHDAVHGVVSSVTHVHEAVHGVVSSVTHVHEAVHEIVSSVAQVHDTLHDLVAAVGPYLDIFSIDAAAMGHQGRGR